MLGSGKGGEGGVPVRAVPLINGRGACRALLRGRHVARRARDVVVRDNGRTHRLERPEGGVAPVRGRWGLEGVQGWGGVGRGAFKGECWGKEGGGEEESKKQSKLKIINDK